MYPITRCRSQVDDPHCIRDPYGPHPQDMDVWVHTLLQKRIPHLYKTPAGVPGHAEQIGNEIRRLSKFPKGESTKVVAKAIEISKLVRHSLNKAKKDAEERSCSYLWRAYLHFLSAA